MKNKIKKAILNFGEDTNYRNKIEFPIESKYDCSDIENITRWLAEDEIISFEFYERTTDSDSWVQCEYYSKIGKTIIWDYDVQASFEDIDELSEYLAKMEEKIQKFESSLELPLEEVIVEEKDTADICEEAHGLTKKECEEKGIEMDKTDKDGNTIYTDKAQEIFNKHFDNIENK